MKESTRLLAAAALGAAVAFSANSLAQKPVTSCEGQLNGITFLLDTLISKQEERQAETNAKLEGLRRDHQEIEKLTAAFGR